MALAEAEMTDEAGIAAQRARVDALRERLAGIDRPEATELAELADYLVRKSVWIVGGDGWAYDIGYGGLDHALASGRDVNILVLDTEGYSNTGGQASKATPLGAVAKFAADGKGVPKKDLGMLAMAYGNVYVAQVAMGAKDTQTFKALVEAESWPGPSLVIAYSHCIEHGYDLADAIAQQEKAVQSGYWPLYRFDPRNPDAGRPRLKLDSAAPAIPLREFAAAEGRFGRLAKSHPERAERLMEEAEEFVRRRFEGYRVRSQQRPAGSDEA